jgi:hypothetical protein
MTDTLKDAAIKMGYRFLDKGIEIMGKPIGNSFLTIHLKDREIRQWFHSLEGKNTVWKAEKCETIEDIKYFEAFIHSFATPSEYEFLSPEQEAEHLLESTRSEP